MIRSFSIPENEVGKWAGITAAIFSLSQALMGIPWGRFSDIYGRKPAILLGLLSTMLTSLLWGFSRTLPMAIVARALSGAGNGNVGIIRTTVAEMVPFKELQPRAFSIMPLVWNIGSIFGPSIGGALANPMNVEPGEQVENPGFFQLFPYSLPNIVSAGFFTFGIIVGFLFLEETLETLQGSRDYGLRLGDSLKSLAKTHLVKAQDVLRLRSSAVEGDEREPLIKSMKTDEELPTTPPSSTKVPPPTFREVLTKQSVLNLVVYALLAMHNMGYDQLLPVYMQYPSIHSDSPYITKPGTDDNYLKFAGGFSLDHWRIGLISTCYGVCGMLIQFFIFPPVARRLGILYCLKWCVSVFPIVYILMPFTALLPNQKWQVGVCFAIMVVKCFCGIFAFPCSTILITNAAPSLRVLGTLNGMATSTSAIGRAAGPAIGGAMFTLGAKRGYVLAPWWTFSALAVLAAIPVFWLEEGEGFGGDDGEVSDQEEVDEIEELLREDGLEGEAEAVGKPGPIFVPGQQQTVEHVEEEEEAYGDIGGLLSRTTTHSSAVLDDETAGSDSFTVSDRRSSEAGAPGVTRRVSRRVLRKTSLPIGMGREGISRRYSSNLGQSFGTAGSYNGN
ncbi:hypothetical protein LTR62_005764 [Meristemomyces frigidus]|uniref:Major facilitator superfamily (MFS) profile domain-containing protein n=1 Tax=Meristemomyces frigidus TaxID=1508187 RepID=A0AAN7YQF3_9PEZI|nr:hypothetical protein LTR62_005764 [Meristemomyces frigidus]